MINGYSEASGVTMRTVFAVIGVVRATGSAPRSSRIDSWKRNLTLECIELISVYRFLA